MLEKNHFITCPNCRTKLTIAKMNGLGRKPLNISVKNICDTLQTCSDIRLAAEQLGCSRAYIYRELSKYGVRPKEVMQGKCSNLPPIAK